MASKMPTLGPAPRKSPLPKVMAVALIVGGATGAIYWWKNRGNPTGDAVSAISHPAVPGTPLDANAPDGGSFPMVAEVKAPPTAADRLAEQGLRLVSTTIHGPLESAIVKEAGPEVGPALTQVVTRTLVWWVSVPGELLRGDKLDILFEERAGQEPLVHAVRFESNKTGKTHKAFLYKPEGEPYPRYYEPTGDELELRIKNSPMDSYEQITSLLRDGRRHKGVDFKAPEGSPVKATFDGIIRRRNWNFRGNGNSLEIVETGGKGRKAMYLHLAELPVDMKVGTRVKRGQVIAASGNTGRSFAPHLHYQLMLGDSKVLDPFTQHETYRRTLPAGQKTAFEAEMSRLETLMSGTVAGK